MRKKLLIVLALALSILALVLIGPDTPGQNPQEGSEAIGENTAGENTAGENNAGGPLETFEPTEKLPADSAISYPVDI